MFICLLNLRQCCGQIAAAGNHHSQGRHGPVLLATVSSKSESAVCAESPILSLELFHRPCVRTQHTNSGRLRFSSAEFGPCLPKLWRQRGGGLWCTTSDWPHGRT